MDVCERTRAKASIFLGDGARPSGWIEDPCAQGVEPCRSAGIGGAVLRRRVLRGRRSAGGGARARTPHLRRERRTRGILQARPAMANGPASASTSARLWLPPSSTARMRSSSSAVPPSDRFAALQVGRHRCADSRDVALASRLDTEHGIRFPGVLVFDGQGFMVRKSQGVASALELSGARICVTAETADAAGRRRLFRRAQDALRDRQVRQVAGGGRGLRQQELPGAVRRHLRAGAGAPAVGRARQAHHPARDRQPAADRTRRSGRATRTGSASCAGPSMR